MAKQKQKLVPVPSLADVLATYIKYVVREYYPGDTILERLIQTYILHLQQLDATDDQIYDALEEMNPMLGNPLAFYETFVEGEDDRHKAAAKAAAKAAREAEEAARQAEVEFVNKRQCTELEQETRDKQSAASNLTTANVNPLTVKTGITVGDYVFVEADLSRGMCSYGGQGFVTAMDGDGATRMFTVTYDKYATHGGQKESFIPYNRITEVPTTYASPKLQRARSLPTNFAEESAAANAPSPKPAPIGIAAILTQGYNSNRGKGWRAKELKVFSSNRKHSEQFIRLLREDAKELQGVLSVQSNCHEGRGRGGLFKKRTTQFTPVSMKYLAKAWGVGVNYPGKLLKQQSTKSEYTISPPNLPVVESKVAATVRYSPRNMFIADRIRQRKEEEEVYAFDNSKENRKYVFREQAKAEWALLPLPDRQYWESRSRSQIERQPFIADNIIEAMRANPAKSYAQISADIGHWCCAATIQKWISSKLGCATYAQRTLPLLTTAQMEKHVAFAKRLRNNWGLPPQKILWIHYDEKWFFGWVNRCNAKMCEVLGLERTHTYIYHKNHIEKVMAVAFTAFAFNGNVENGGDGIKLGLYRVQAARIAKKTVRKGRRDEHGRMRYDGAIVRMEGDPYLVDCNVTGSDEGTSDKPRFSLMALFRDQIFPKIATLVGPGGEYAGYLPLIQGDNAGPHTDATFTNFVKGHCASKGWKWEPQAAQMPHMNNLDLAVFPMMSKRHSALLTRYSNKMAPPQEIWDGALSVWREMGSPEIARGFILAYRIAAKVITNKGSNTFLQQHDFHSGVRQDFYPSATGVKKKTNVLV